jgi:hypothetical protein
MKILLTTLSFVLLTLSLKAQPITPYIKDTIIKKDTVYVQVPVYEHYDTLKTNLVKGKWFLRKKEGFIITKGLAIQRNNQWQWVNKPELIGYLKADKRRRMKHVIATL